MPWVDKNTWVLSLSMAARLEEVAGLPLDGLYQF
jgi:hypothetical protein